MKEQEIVHTAQRAFRETTGGTIADMKYQRAQIQPFDIMLQLRLRQFREALLAKVKHEVRKQDIPQIMEQFRYVIPGANQEKLLVAQYIPGPVKEELRKLHINYLEATGNCCIQLENMFLFVNDRKAAPVRKTTEGRLWNKTGLKYVFAFLRNPEILELPLREQAAIAGIALGNIPDLKLELFEFTEGLPITRGNPQWKQILQRWGLNYTQVLKPTHAAGRYKFWDKEQGKDWKTLQLPAGNWWGAEPAANLLTNYLRPEILTIYTRNKTKLVNTWKLLPDENGPLELFEPFWPDTQDPLNHKTVDPIIAWAELNFDLDQRMRETADRINKQYFNEDYDKRVLLLLK